MCLTKATLTYDEIYSNEKPYGSTMRLMLMDKFGNHMNKQTWVEPKNQDNILRTCRNEIKEDNIISIGIGSWIRDENPYKIDFFLKLMCLTCFEDEDEICRERIDYNILLFSKEVNAQAVLSYLSKNQGFVKMPEEFVYYKLDFQEVVCDAYKFAPTYITLDKC